MPVSLFRPTAIVRTRRGALAPLLMVVALLAGGSLTAQAATKQSAAAFAAEMSVNAETQAKFFARFPDLKDEPDIVAQAARGLAYGYQEPHLDSGEVLAIRARGLLAQRTPQDWQRRAISLFPELGVADSDFNKRFVTRYRELKESSSKFMEEPSWPVLLARRVADELKVPPASASSQPTASEIADAPVVGRIVRPPLTPAQARVAFWISVLSFVVLLGLVLLPARWLWQTSRAFAGNEPTDIFWQRAFRPAAGAWFVAALFFLWRTFVAHAALAPWDRFQSALVVSLVAGFAAALLGYLAALAVALRRLQVVAEATPPAPRTSATRAL